MKKRSRRKSRIAEAYTAKASEFIKSIKFLRRGARVVLLVRVSGPSQDPSRQLKALHAAAAKLGLHVIGRVVARCPGHDIDGPLPSWATCTWAGLLARARALAIKHRAAILATETDRLVRNEQIALPGAWDARPTSEDLQTLGVRTEGVSLVTLSDPDASPSLVRREASEQGIKAHSGRQGGRPRAKTPGWQKRRREDKQPKARRLRVQGLSYGEIAKRLTLTRSTVQRWTQDCRVQNP